MAAGEPGAVTWEGKGRKKPEVRRLLEAAPGEPVARPGMVTWGWKGREIPEVYWAVVAPAVAEGRKSAPQEMEGPC